MNANTDNCNSGRTTPDHVRPTRESYAAHLRQSSRTSSDGFSFPVARPHSAIIPPRDYSPAPSRPSRPLSLLSLPDHGHYPRSRKSYDRWSYDRERMPTRPETPPTPQLNSSRPSSRRSELLPVQESTSYSYSDRPFSHRRVFSTGDLLHVPHKQQQLQQQQQYRSHPRPRPIPQPLQLDTSESTSMSTREHEITPSETPPVFFQIVDPDSPRDKTLFRLPTSTEDDAGYLPEVRKEDQGKEEVKPGCCGLCELGTAKVVGGKIAAWMTGTVLPIMFVFVRECLVKGCK